MSARWPPCSASSRRCSRRWSREQFGAKAKLIDANLEALRHGPRRRAAERCEPIGLQHAPLRHGRRPHLRRGQHRRGAGRGLWRGDGLRLVSDHALDLAGRGLHRATARSCASTRRPARRATPSSRPRTRSPRSASWSAPAGTARAPSPAPPGPGISLMQEFIGLSYFAEIPAVIFDVQRGGPSTGMPTRTQQSDILLGRLRQPRRHQAPAAVPRGPGRVLRVRRAGLRPRRPAADHHLRHARPRHRHERVAVPPLRLGRQRASSTAAR